MIKVLIQEETSLDGEMMHYVEFECICSTLVKVIVYLMFTVLTSELQVKTSH